MAKHFPPEVRAEKKKEFIENYPKYGNKKETCRAMNISTQAVSLWACRDEAFREEYERVKAERVAELAGFLYRVGTDETIKVSMPNITAAIFLLKNLDPRNFGERSFREETRKSIKVIRKEVIKDYGDIKTTETKEFKVDGSISPVP
jgi:hypothetical protein